MKKGLHILIILAGLILLPGAAFAGTIIPDDLAIDFRDLAWRAGIKNKMAPSYTVGSVTTKAGNSKSTGSEIYYLTYEYNDGLGISNISNALNEEINGYDFLTVTLSKGQYLTGVWITDLFGPDNNYKDGSGNNAVEAGILSLQGANVFKSYTFFGDQPLVKDINGVQIYNGDLYVDFGGSIYAESMVFSTYAAFPTGMKNFLKNDFSVAGFTAAPVPEPSTLLLLGGGIAGLVNFMRKRPGKA